MSLAVVDLLADNKVIDVEGVSIKSYPPIRFHVSVKGESEMNYRIVKKRCI